ncbi:MAG: hypothetical protein RL248_1588 [Pseudomonadota bacterium]
MILFVLEDIGLLAACTYLNHLLVVDLTISKLIGINEPHS